ncbi:MAG: hypothetical protein QOE09_181 [Ilumatobacteraceae bacterium]
MIFDPELRRRYDTLGHDFGQVPEGVRLRGRGMPNRRGEPGFGQVPEGLGLVADLLDRIEQLESAQRRRLPNPTASRGPRRWT